MITHCSMGTVIKRPSRQCQSPYVADVVMDNQDNQVIAHSPALGCCGLSDTQSRVICSKISAPREAAICTHRIDLAVLTSPNSSPAKAAKAKAVLVGINPKLAEVIAQNALKHGKIKCLQNIQSYRTETVMLNSRFDFTGVDEMGRSFVMEVKNVPLADVVDVPKKEKKAALKEVREKQNNQDNQDNQDHAMIAYFPDGYRKSLKPTEVVSSRALKHVQELQEIACTTNMRAILCFVIQRSDVTRFQPSKIDPLYRAAVLEAWRHGVEIITLQTMWVFDENTQIARCVVVSSCDLPIMLADVYGPLPMP